MFNFINKNYVIMYLVGDNMIKKSIYFDVFVFLIISFNVCFIVC